MSLNEIRYKNFEFPHNPETTGFKCGRTYIKHKYPELSGAELEDFSVDAISITGSGLFYGRNAYKQFRNLYNEYKKPPVGRVYHPVFSEVRRGLMVNLEADIKPETNVIHYTFEIIADTRPNIDEDVTSEYNNASYGGGDDPIIIPIESSGQPAQQNVNSIVHVVKKNECLSKICAKYSTKYGTSISWREVAKYNSIPNPNKIYPGQEITIRW